jgi:D-beta-D-heptose 7-phosphate kinase / D-beta-D-heptose 1-phosphate adenosyltransferase
MLNILKKISKKEKSKLNKIGLVTGVFDLLHPGHIHLLNFAKKKCNFLFVGVNKDNYIKNVKKNKVLLNEKSRLLILDNIISTDYVFIFDHKDLLKIIGNIKPDVICVGPDYNKDSIVGYDFVKKIGGKVFILREKYKTRSSLLKRIAN